MSRMRSIGLAALTLAAAGALAGQAGAATYCVSDAACVSAGGIDRGSDLQAALTAASSVAGADTVKIGAGSFSAADGFNATDSNAAIAVVGAGRGLTTLTATTAGRIVLDFGASRDATVSDLFVAMPPSGGVGVFVPQHIARVAIAGGTGAATGLWTQNTTVDDVAIDLPLDGSSNTGLYRPNGVLRADGLSVTAHSAINGFGGGDKYKHLRVTSDGTGVSLGSSIGNAMTIDDAQIRMTGSGTGLQFQAIFGTAASLTARFVTIRGDGTRDSIGVDAHGSSAGSIAAVTLEDSIVERFDHALSCSVASSGAARFAVRWSAFDPGDLVQGCSTAIDTRTGNLAIEPTLLPAPNGDLLLPEGSAAIDAGDPALTSPSPATDLAGAARLFDGNGDGTARVDMGAFEWAPPPPVIVIADPPAPPPAPPIRRDVPPTIRTPQQPVVEILHDRAETLRAAARQTARPCQSEKQRPAPRGDLHVCAVRAGRGRRHDRAGGPGPSLRQRRPLPRRPRQRQTLHALGAAHAPAADRQRRGQTLDRLRRAGRRQSTARRRLPRDDRRARRRRGRLAAEKRALHDPLSSAAQIAAT